MESNGKIVNRYEEKAAKTYSGFMMLALVLLLVVAGIAMLVVGVITLVQYAELMGDEDAVSPMGIALLIGGILVMTLGGILCAGFKTINPNEAIVLTLFGKYYGTIKKDGFYWTNIFCGGMNPGAGHNARGKISLKTMTLNNEKQTVNDERGNPIIIGTIVIWRIVDTTKAVFNVQNYQTFLSTQCDSATRNIARMYPYDLFEEDDQNEKTLRGSSQEIAAMMTKDLQERVAIAGLEILEVRITHLSYAPEIAAAMLQRQQAEAVVAARKKIVEGAVGMVEMALDQLSEDQVVALDDERKAAMVSNLLVVLCGSKDAQPVVNSGSIY
ncbi:MAG: SPFH domain-containing protein [Acutalibacter sp.]|jgi:regulator of protease activity HflC (stomatin/prohibitin superfamily)|uniref:SPFH domain-containing protein n=1 Tax=Acutalibacter sp. TaxID=1918636 RepID=UPI00216E43E3|nr:SPFH domain-containing protein [Acutalibacter sp.]MCI9224011.1 SPFH domain-containing protein [Acutalibacter sp.]